MTKKIRTADEKPTNGNAAPAPRRQDPWITALAVFAVVLILWALFMGSESREPGGDPAAQAPSGEVVAATGGETARGLIARQSKTLHSADIESVFERAEALRRAGKLEDAYLLYFFAARNGHGLSALQLGDMASPESYNSSGSPLDHPDAYQAFKWYRAAEKAGLTEAGSRLKKLEESLRVAANDNDAQAQRLLMLWR